MTATLDLWQQSYVLAIESGALGLSFGNRDELTKKLASHLDKFYAENQRYLGSWSTVWGPVVYQHAPGNFSPPDNVMYVAANGDKSVYVVGICGTNEGSWYDMNTEDMVVYKVVAWKEAFPSLGSYGIPPGLGSINPYLALGTVDGVNALLEMRTGLTTDPGQTLAQFLQGVADAKATLIIAGHSLGGALSPTLALALVNPAGGPLSIGQWEHVYVYPLAGPTPGNQDFNTFFRSQLPPITGGAGYRVWNQDVWNTLDVVPHAWQVDRLSRIPYLYPATWPQVPKELLDGVQDAIKASEEGGKAGLGAYTMLPNQPLDGTFNKDHPVKDYVSFMEQMAYQHGPAYDDLLSVKGIQRSLAVQETSRSTAQRIIGAKMPVASEKTLT